MKITADRKTLHAALDLARRVVERRNTIPIMSNLRLTAAGDRLQVTATDLDLEVKTALAARVDQEADITLPAHTLRDIVAALPDGDVSIVADDGRATVSAGRSRYRLFTLPVTDYPSLAAEDLRHEFVLSAAALHRLMDVPRFAISTEETRYYLNGIYLHVVDGDDGPALRAVSTDGHRLMRVECLAPAGSAGMPGIIVPRKTVAEIAALAARAGPEDKIAVAVSENKIRITAGETTLISKLIDGSFPDYGRVIPARDAEGTLITIDRAEVLAAAGRVTTLSGDRARCIAFRFAAKGSAIDVNNPDAGEAREDIAAELDGPDITIGFNGKYVADVLGTLTATRITLRLRTAGDPARIESADAATDADLVSVLMPMRVQ